jgi:hypothetical protein
LSSYKRAKIKVHNFAIKPPENVQPRLSQIGVVRIGVVQIVEETLQIKMEVDGGIKKSSPAGANLERGGTSNLKGGKSQTESQE